MNIGFLGFGRTGKEAVYPFLTDETVNIRWILKKSNEYHRKYASDLLLINKEKEGEIFSEADWNEDFLEKYPVDIVVDFSNAENIEKYATFAKFGIKIVSAISNYRPKQIELLNEIAKQTPVFWSPNITLGVNLLITVAKIINEFTPEADIQIIESHFKEKKEISGTAGKIAESLHIPKEDIHSIRAGGILGKHEIVFGYPYQTISLMHETGSGKAFGRGALACAKWITDKPNGLYNMEEMLNDQLRKYLSKL